MSVFIFVSFQLFQSALPAAMPELGVLLMKFLGFDDLLTDPIRPRSPHYHSPLSRHHEPARKYSRGLLYDAPPHIAGRTYEIVHTHCRLHEIDHMTARADEGYIGGGRTNQRRGTAYSGLVGFSDCFHF